MSGFIFEEATIETVHKAMEKEKLSCEQLTRWYLQRIKKYDKGKTPLNSIIVINHHAIETAKKLDKEYKKSGFTGPLHGIPVLLKDNCETYDMPTSGGSKSLEGWNSGKDAFITKKLRKAGAVIIAKTNLHEFAVWGETISSILGQTYNPYDYTRTPGGSSGGTGAAIAANFGIIGIGTDTVNSIRSPASACALCGLRPTVGLVSRNGIIPYSLTQDTAGPITRTVEDAVKTLDVIAGYDTEDPDTELSLGRIPKTYKFYLNPNGLVNKRIGVLRSFVGGEEINKPVSNLFEKNLEELRFSGADLVDITEHFDSTQLVSEVSLHLHDLKTHLGQYLSSYGNKIPVHSIEEILKSGKYTTNIKENFEAALKLDVNTPEYGRRIKKRQELKRHMLGILEKNNLDAFVYPHQQQLVCKVGATQNQRNGVLAAITGFPAITVPGGFSPPDKNAPIGVPVGLEFLARPFDEGTLIEIAYGYESRHNKRKPPAL